MVRATQAGRLRRQEKAMIPAFARTALARKLLIALRELARTGTVPPGVRRHAAI
jgi:hypothetical protein